ncbi:glutamate receptor ionotropic, kainate glr-3-like isoform X1 [Temnothorax americanus]|uniref:glutamate receptor ionotropic, kainate glr-3-like isoform X1 n=2 Tax=Temnothorax americanus TaxID=1964332 RepID=UPI00406896D3
MATRFVLTVAIFYLMIWDCYAVSGVIWHKQQQKFVQLFSIPEFAALHQENLAKRRATEKSDMSGEVVKAVYYEEKNIVMFLNNDTKVRGVYGGLWHVLAGYLNFTFIPIRVTDRNFGQRLENGTQNGLVGMLARNEAQVILRSGFYPSRFDVVDYTMPLWRSRFHIYVRPEWQFNNTWVFTLFTWQMWFYILFLFIILSCVGYFLQKVPTDKPKRKRKGSMDFSLGDHFFYSLAIMSTQGYVPDAFYNKFKILSLSKSIFAWLILLAFNSQLIYRMTNREMTLPFKDVESVINNTKYILLAWRNSIFYSSFVHKYGGRHDPTARVRFIEAAEDMHGEICNKMTKYAMFEIEDRFMAMSKSGCPLQAIGNFNETWITFALQKNYPYRKTIDNALLKFREVGLIDACKNYWLNTRVENRDHGIFKTIDLHQVYLIFLILSYGVLISLVILVLEHIMYYYEEMKNSRPYKRR